MWTEGVGRSAARSKSQRFSHFMRRSGGSSWSSVAAHQPLLVTGAAAPDPPCLGVHARRDALDPVGRSHLIPSSTTTLSCSGVKVSSSPSSVGYPFARVGASFASRREVRLRPRRSSCSRRSPYHCISDSAYFVQFQRVSSSVESAQLHDVARTALSWRVAPPAYRGCETRSLA